MALVSSSGFAHVRLTVRDIARSKTFYDQVLGWPIAVDNPHRGALFGLQRVGSTGFDPDDINVELTAPLG